jgi:acyl carrier protein
VTTFDRVKKVIIELLEVSEEAVTPEASLYNDLCLDSEAIEFVLSLEEEFGFEIPDEDFERLSATVAGLVAYIDQRLSA